MPADLANDIREGEVAVPLPSGFDAGVYFIGRIRTPWRERGDCPRQGDLVAGPVCRIEVFAPWSAALAGIGRHEHLDILYWMQHARRDLVLQTPRHAPMTMGAFALRSPVRPNPIALVARRARRPWARPGSTCAGSIAWTRRRSSTSSRNFAPTHLWPVCDR